MAKVQRYTVSLPENVYEELKQRADRHSTSINNVLRQCVKFGLLAAEIDEKDGSEIIFREKTQPGTPVRETQVSFIW